MAAGALVAHRRVLGTVIGVTSVVTVALGVRYNHTHTPGRFDRAVDGRLRDQLASHGGILQRLVDLANPGNVVIVCCVMFVVFFAAGRRRVALLGVLGPAVAGILVDIVLKPLFDRRIRGQLSFPSGHTTAAMSLALVVVIAMFGPSHPRWPRLVRAAVAVVAVAGACCVAIALIGAGYHYATDTVGGVTIATASVLSVAIVIDALADRRTPTASGRHSLRVTR